MVVENVTPQLQREAESVDESSKEASRKLKSRRPVQNYLEMGIPAGSVLEFTRGNITCEVVSGRKVSLDGEEYSLTALTQKLLETESPLQPSPYWSYQGKQLSEIYEDTYDIQ
jgi:hypothetical protein